MLKPHAYQGWFTAALLTLLFGCQKKDADTPGPANDSCQIQTILSVSQDGEREQYLFAYNTQGLLLSRARSSTTVTGSVTWCPFAKSIIASKPGSCFVVPQNGHPEQSPGFEVTGYAC